MCWVDGELDPHEDFLGLYKVGDIQSDVIVAILQCYDGANNMAGSKSGVSTQLSKEWSHDAHTVMGMH